MRKQSRVIVVILVLVASLMLPFFRSVPKVYAAGVPIDETEFPDDNFRAYVAQNDLNGNGILEQDELDQVVVIYCNGMQIADLTGIEHFANLRYFDCSSNQLIVLDMSIFPDMVELNCSSNQLIDLDLTGCSSLTTLDCSYNQLEELDVTDCSSLIELECSNNQLVELDVSGCSSLVDLRCSHNGLTSLDVSNCADLDLLICVYNELTSLIVSNLENLSMILCDYNKLESIDLSGCSSLENFALNHNLLTSLDLSGYANLRDLSCFENELTSLKVTGCGNLEYLNCDHNNLTSLKVTGCGKLGNLSCGHNNLTSLDLSGCTAALYAITCDNNDLTSLFLPSSGGLTDLLCSHNQLTSLDVSSQPELMELHCVNNQLTELNVNGCARLWTLNCSDNLLTSLDVSSCEDLWQLESCPQAAGTILVVQNDGRYEVDLGDLPGVNIANITAVTLADGSPLPNGCTYDIERGILTIGADLEPEELRYLYDTQADLEKLDDPPMAYLLEEELWEQIIVSTPQMEVYFTWAKPGLLEVAIPENLNEENDVDLTDDSIVYQQDKSTGATFRVIGADIEDFKSVKVNGKELMYQTDYTIEAGSIIVKLTQAFLRTLPPGQTYTVEVVTRKGSGIKTLKVEPSAEPTEPTEPTIPATGETRYTQLFLLAVLLLLAGTVLLLNSFFFRKRVSQR
jgi:hypothetical protein